MTTIAHHYESAPPNESAPPMLDDLGLWFLRDNFYRKARRIGKKTPYEAALAWYETDPALFIRESTTLLAYHSQSYET